MHFISTKQDLIQAVNIVNRAVSTKSPMAILAGIRFEVQEDQLLVSATDLEMGIRCVTPVGSIETGAVVLPAKYITELIRHLPEGSVTMSEDRENGSVIVQYGDSETIINCFPEEEFPEIDFPSSERSTKMQESVLRDALRKVLFAVASDDRRGALTGAYFVVGADFIELVTTDLHRMAWCKILLAERNSKEIKVIVPGKALNELSKIIGKSGSTVDITFNESNVVFTTDNISFITRLLNGKFPDYKKVIPERDSTRIRVRKQDLQEATERAGIFSTEDNSSIKMVVSDGAISITDTAIDGRVYEEIAAELDGEETEIGLNVYYLNELLRVIDSEVVVIEFYGPVSPCVFKQEGTDNYYSLIVPVKV